jgi:hypothetical protein
MADESELEELDLYADTEAAKVTVDRQQRLHPQPLTSSDIEPRVMPPRPLAKPSSKLLWVLLFLNLLMLLFSGGAFLVIVGVDNAVSQMLIQQQQLLNLTKS